MAIVKTEIKKMELNCDIVKQLTRQVCGLVYVKAAPIFQWQVPNNWDVFWPKTIYSDCFLLDDDLIGQFQLTHSYILCLNLDYRVGKAERKKFNPVPAFACKYKAIRVDTKEVVEPWFESEDAFDPNAKKNQLRFDYFNAFRVKNVTVKLYQQQPLATIEYQSPYEKPGGWRRWKSSEN